MNQNTNSRIRSTRHILKGLMAAGIALAVVSATPICTFAQDKALSDDETKERYAAFTELMTNSKLVGSFTVLGQTDKELKAEEYHIKSVEKLDEGNKWKFVARIKYGKYDVSVPMTLDVIWAGDTPVITLTDAKIPFMGSFSSRVVIYNGKYSGTWSHGDVGGHLFGKIERGAEGVDVEKTKKEMEDKEKKSGESEKSSDG